MGLGHKTFTRERLTSDDVNGYLMDQAVMSFTSSANRTAELPAPVDGMLSYLEDKDRFEARIDGAWLPILGKMPTCRLTVGAGGPYTASADIKLDTQLTAASGNDPDGLWNNSTKRLTIPYGGCRWRLHGKLYLSGSSAMTTVFALRATRAATTAPSNVYASAAAVTGGGIVSFDHEQTFASADTIEWQVWTNQAGVTTPANSFGALPYLELKCLGPAVA